MLDPLQRPTLEQILAHPFISHEGGIPENLPVSTLACPPSATYLRQFLPGNTQMLKAEKPVSLVQTLQTEQLD